MELCSVDTRNLFTLSGYIKLIVWLIKFFGLDTRNKKYQRCSVHSGQYCMYVIATKYDRFFSLVTNTITKNIPKADTKNGAY